MLCMPWCFSMFRTLLLLPAGGSVSLEEFMDWFLHQEQTKTKANAW